MASGGGWSGDAFSVFAAANLVGLTRFAFRLTGDAHDAGDLAQEALIRTGTRWEAIRRRDSPEVYARRVVTTLYVDGWRRRQRERRHVERAEPLPHVPADVEDRLDLLGALSRLAPRQRAVLVLRYYLDYSEAQTAEVLGVAVGTVKRQASDALARLRLDTELLTDRDRSSS